MEQIQKLEREVKQLSLAIRVGLSALIVGYVIRSLFTLGRAGKFEMIFNDLMEGKALPIITQFYMNFSTHIMVLLVVISIITIALLFIRSRLIWSIPLAIFVVIANIAICETAILAFQMPMIAIISSLGM